MSVTDEDNRYRFRQQGVLEISGGDEPLMNKNSEQNQVKKEAKQ